MNVIVTGSARGIGRAVAEKFAADGSQIFMCARDAVRLQKTADEMRKSFPSAEVHTLVADLSSPAAAKDFSRFCLGTGAPDILVNNAGGYVPGRIMNEADGTLEGMIANNLYSAYWLTRELLPAMIANGGGHIFNMCSVASLEAYEGGGSYSISKYALHGFSTNLRQELKPHKIKVTAVFPGAVMTDSWGDFDNSDHRIMEASDIAEVIYAATKLSAAAVPEEIILRPQLGDLD